MLPRIAPSELLARSCVTPITIVLLCAPTQHLCTILESELTEPASQLAVSRSLCAVRMVDASEPGGETLRPRVGAGKDAHVLVFKDDMATLAAGLRDLRFLTAHVSQARACGRASVCTCVQVRV